MRSKPRTPTTSCGYIFRWYSREFSVPLPEVERQPVEEVLNHFFECRYEGMDDEALDDELKSLAETRAERLAREEREKLDEEDADEFFKQAKAEPQVGLAKLGATPKRTLDAPMEDPDLDRPVLVPVMGERLPQGFQDIVAKMDSNLKEVPPEIKMEFVSEDELGNLDDWDILGPAKPRDDG
jgi:hypothetical protein